MKKIMLVLIAAISLVAIAHPPIALADAKDDVCRGINVASGKTGAACGTGSGANQALTLTINLLSLVVGIAAVIMIIIGGLKYVTSQGDSNNINSAKNTILYAVIGLVVVALAQVIVRFVLKRVSG